MMNFNEKINEFEKLEKVDEVHGKRVLTPDQSIIFKSIINTYRSGGMAFLQGGAGSGKTVLIRALKKYCDANEIKCAVTATTGKASSALEGATIHSYMGLSMKQNNNAETIEDALVLGTRDDFTVEMPEILIIDEASMIGQKLLNEIMQRKFRYILYVGDLNQLPPVKDKKVDWKGLVQYYYELTKTLRTKEPSLAKLFNDFKLQKEGELHDLDIFDYVNGENIVEVEYADLNKLPKNSLSCFVGYRNKLVEKFANRLTHEDNTMYNLNVGVVVTAMVVDDELTQNDNGYYIRNFENQQKFFNGEDVEIIKLTDTTSELVKNGFAMYGKWKLKLTKKGILITNSTARKEKGEAESKAPKYFISFPQDEVLEYCTLSIINGETFTLVWDGSEEEFKEMLDYYFDELKPQLKIDQVIRAYHKGKDADLSVLPIDIKHALTQKSNFDFMIWYEFHEENDRRRLGWKNLLTSKSVVSARPVSARTVTKGQGISVPCVILCEDSFYGASDRAKYVAVTRAKYGMVLVRNVPTDWR